MRKIDFDGIRRAALERLDVAELLHHLIAAAVEFRALVRG